MNRSGRMRWMVMNEMLCWALPAAALGLMLAGGAVVRGAPVSAGGGDEVYDIVVDGELPYRAHVFTNTGPAMLAVSNAGLVEVLVVAGGGGGGGGAMAGGGGAGGVIFEKAYSVVASNYSVTVGAGGLGGYAYNLSNQAGVRGEDSAFGVELVAVGGGGGAGWTGHPSSSGGSGGGGNSSVAASPGTDGQGHAGNIGSSTTAQRSGGGGGGAGKSGGLGLAGAGGKGGDGIAVFGDYYGGGGGGGLEGTPLVADGGGAGGLGGGGAGSKGSTRAMDASPNTGGGGGGAGYNTSSTGRLGGNGGSGVVIVRYSLAPMTPVPPVKLANIQTGSERFTNTNKVRIVDFPAFAGYDHFQYTGEDRSVAALESDGWLSTNSLMDYVAAFDRPETDTNITLYVWFTNTTDTAMPLLRSAGTIYYTSEAPVPVIRSSLSRNRLAGGTAVVTVEDIDAGSHPGTANGLAMNLHARKVHIVDPAADLTPGKPYASLGAAGEYPVVYWMRNEAGNEATSSVTCLVTVADVEATTNFWTGSGGTASWHNPGNWLAGVPSDNQHAAITQAVSVVIDRPSWALRSFTMTAGTLVFTNWITRLEAADVALLAGTVTLPPAFTTSQMSNRVWIVCSNLTLAATATVEASACGYARGYGPGSANGASHGGRGSSGNWDLFAPVYGEVSEPDAPGSGGQGNGVPQLSGDGGGAVRIEAWGTATIHGKIQANGANRVTTHGGGGAGGSIWISCRRFAGSGTGSLSATGGTGANFGGAGGGGRIAVVYDPAAQAAAVPVNPGVAFNVSQGSVGHVQPFAEAGTLYFPDTAFLSGTMGTQWGGGFLHIPGFTSWRIDSLTVVGKFALQGVTNLVVTNGLTVAAGGILALQSVPTNAVSPPDGILVDIGGDLSVTGTVVLACHDVNGAAPRVLCSNLTVAAGGKIDADYRGYTGLRTGGYSGPVHVVDLTRGAGHGGMGSSGWGDYTAAGLVYGTPMEPVQPGSGGGRLGLGGYGGGAIRLQVAETATIHGTVTANGQAGIGTHGSGGSGGSIFLACQTFCGSATGVLQAKGGNGDNYQAGAGGGGRIAVVYDPVQQAALPQPNPGVTFSVAAGTGGQFPHLAENGTLYLPAAATLFLSTNMTAQWQGVQFHLPGGLPYWSPPSLNIGGKFQIPGLKTLTVAGDMNLASGGKLTLFSGPTNSVEEEIGQRLTVGGKLTLASGAELELGSDLLTGASPLVTCGSFDLQAGGVVQADYRGWEMNLGAGHGISRAGGGHGGAGSRGADVVANAGPCNGVAWAPLWPGSGAGNYGSSGGRGGGFVRIGAHGAMRIDGTIRVNGMARKKETHAGGGSGGGILLAAGTFSGAGLLQVKGGSSGNNGGAGGGGRIAVWTPYLAPAKLRWMAGLPKPPGSTEWLDYASLYPDLTLDVAAGTGGANPVEAQPGTIFFGRLVPGTLIILR